jgi:hypothetical protein
LDIGKIVGSFVFSKLCTKVAKFIHAKDQVDTVGEIIGTKPDSIILTYDSHCNITGNDLVKGSVTCNFEERLPWWLNACPGADPTDFDCTTVATLAVTGAVALFPPIAVVTSIVGVGLEDVAIGVALECASRLGDEACEKIGNLLFSDDNNVYESSNQTKYSFPDDVPSCPPTLALANLDPTFIVDQLCTDTSNCVYNPGADVCFISAIPSPSGGAQQCCYSKGQINITAPAAGHPMISHPSLLARIPNMAVDRRINLCCYVFLWSSCKDPRPSDPGQNYNNSQPALGNGDAHFTTFDGLYYTFNGAGEFWLLRNTTTQTLAVQTRMVPSGSYSLLEAYAMKTANSSVLQIEQTSTGEFIVYYDSVLIPPNIWQNGINFDDIYISYDGDVTVSFSNEFSFKFSPLSLNSFAPRSYFGNYTQGILGSYDNNPFNDLTTPDGILLPANSTTEVIHYKFGLKWSVTEDESLFNYFGKNYSDFNFPEFKPSFGYSAGQLPPNAAEICGNDQSCLWDLVTTGDESLANQTRSNNEDFNQTVSTTSQNITMCPTFDDIENGSFVLNNYLLNSVVTFYCDIGFELQGDTNLICQADGSWNGTEPSCDFVATTTVEIETTTEIMTKNPSSSKSSSPTSAKKTTTSSTTSPTTTTTQEATTSNAEQLCTNLSVFCISFALTLLAAFY